MHSPTQQLGKAVAGQETNTEDGTSTVLIYFALK
jgi:hypothetical protein